MFVGHLCLPAVHPKDLSKDAIWQKRLDHRFLIDAAMYKDSVIPFIACTESLGVVNLAVASDTAEHRGVHDISALRNYALAEIAR